MVTQPVVVEGTLTVNVPQDRAWSFLKHPASLSACIPGVSNITARQDGTFQATVEVAISVLKAQFDMQVRIAEEQPLSCLVAEMSGSDAKTGTLLKTRNRVDLTPKNSGQTRIAFRIDAVLSGKLAALGGGMAVKLHSRRMARAFAATLKQNMEAREG